MAEQVVATDNKKNLPVKNDGFWAKIKAFFTKDVEITMTPSQQKIVDFLSRDVEVKMTPSQERTINKMKQFFLQEITLDSKKSNQSYNK